MLTAALRHPQPEIRLVAARVAAASRKECSAAAALLAGLEVADADHHIVAGATPWLLMPLNTEIVACADRSPTKSFGRIAPDRQATRTITPPRKTKHINPTYPANAQRAGVQGVVLEANLSDDGCLAGVRIVRSVVPALDVEALSTVLRWRYEPTLLDGVAVPTVMTLTVNFTLR